MISRSIFSRTGVAIILGATLVFGVVIGYFLPRFDWEKPKITTASIHTASKPEERAGLPTNIKQDGIETSVDALISVYETNPNRFSTTTEKSVFAVEGIISRVGESSILDKTSGFYIPLSNASNEHEWFNEQISASRESQDDSVSLFVKGLSKAELSDLDPGDLIEAKCPKVRVVAKNLVFDDCTRNPKVQKAAAEEKK